jgi:hypothetical protein
VVGAAVGAAGARPQPARRMNRIPKNSVLRSNILHLVWLLVISFMTGDE